MVAQTANKATVIINSTIVSPFIDFIGAGYLHFLAQIATLWFLGMDISFIDDSYDAQAGILFGAFGI